MRAGKPVRGTGHSPAKGECVLGGEEAELTSTSQARRMVLWTHRRRSSRPNKKRKLNPLALAAPPQAIRLPLSPNPTLALPFSVPQPSLPPPPASRRLRPALPTPLLHIAKQLHALSTPSATPEPLCPSTLSLSDLSSVLASLSPSLVSLAPVLHRNALNNRTRLAGLLFLSEEELRGVFEELELPICYGGYWSRRWWR